MIVAATPGRAPRTNSTAALRRDVLKHDLEPGDALDHAREHTLDECALAVEHVHIRIRDFPVHLQYQPELRHRFERGPRRARSM